MRPFSLTSPLTPIPCLYHISPIFLNSNCKNH
nr:MAG TPA: hypothetical protein [Caudoviricetes sp.]